VEKYNSKGYFNAKCEKQKENLQMKKKKLWERKTQSFKVGDGGIINLGNTCKPIGVNRPDCQHTARLPDYRANVKGQTVTRLGDKKINHETGRFNEFSVYELRLIQTE
jgi:hypothetical protein